MHDFEYLKAASLADAVKALKAAPDAVPVSGGMTLLPTLKLRLAQPSHLIDIARLKELQGIKVDGASLTIGAGTTHRAVATSADVRAFLPALAAMADLIGDPQVRNRGTIGGSVANNDPAADYPAACIALGATVITSEREVAADDFFVDLFETALQHGELVTAVRFPKPKRAAYQKFRNPASRYAMVGVFVAETEKGVRVAVTGAGQSGVFRVPEMEAALAASFAPASVAAIKVDPERLNSDIHGSAAYRAHLVTVMAKRAVEQALG
jgi:aerobic carbon-monoxide dehydrogenase medium subunit